MKSTLAALSAVSLAIALPAGAETLIIPLPWVEVIAAKSVAFGNVGILTVKISNGSKEHAVSDIVLRCKFIGNSGSTISTKTKTIYETINPGKSVIVKDLNLGLIDGQSKRADCNALDAIGPDGKSID